MISTLQIEFFRENGYLIVEDTLSQAEIEAVLNEAVNICRGGRGSVQGLPEFHPDENDDDIIRRVLCIHHPHKISRKVLDLIHHPAIVDVLTAVVSPNVKCMQSMLFIKSAGKPGQAWHQDEDFIPTRDRSLIAQYCHFGLPSCVGQPLHERRVTPALVAIRGHLSQCARFSRYCDGGWQRPVCTQGD